MIRIWNMNEDITALDNLHFLTNIIYKIKKAE